jgi:hypothetical protein
MQSVAHLPMKAFVYKFLGTIVDDFFACVTYLICDLLVNGLILDDFVRRFCIKMPTLHRLACFRDDVVFLIFLYQRWIYRVDPKRVNEVCVITIYDSLTLKSSKLRLQYGQVMVQDDSEGEERKENSQEKKDK